MRSGTTPVQPYLERFIHGEIYRVRPAVKAIVHCPLAGTHPLCGYGHQASPSFYHMSAFLAAGVPIYEIRDWRAAGDKSMLVHNRELGQALARVLGKSNALLMRGHGGVVVAGNSAASGRTRGLSANQCQTASRGHGAGHVRSSIWSPTKTPAGLRSPPTSRNWEIWKREAAGCGKP